MPRGRLIFPFGVTLGLLDTAATAADPDGVGALTSGYDPEFREPRILPPGSGSARGTVVRVETTVLLKAQIEPDDIDDLQMMATGRSPKTTIGLVFHYRDLEAAGMVVLVSGKPMVKAPGARLVDIRNHRTNALIESFDSLPGTYATEARSIGFGLGPDRNLLLVVFEERALSVPGG